MSILNDQCRSSRESMAGVIALTEEPGVPTARRSAGKIYVISCGRTGPGGMPRMVNYYLME
jgi:hypothetical protein